MSVLFSFHYLWTAFFLTAWIGYPYSPGYVMTIHFLTQTILYLAGFDISGNETLFWGWQALISALGMIAGLLILKPKHKPGSLLTWKNKYSWLYFICSLLACLAIQLMYANFPPLQSSPAGQAGVGLAVTFVLSFFLIGMIWYGLTRVKYNHWCEWRTAFFKRWFFFTALLQLLFYTTLTGLDEMWVAVISGGSVIVIAFISLMLCKRRINVRIRYFTNEINK